MGCTVEGHGDGWARGALLEGTALSREALSPAQGSRPSKGCPPTEWGACRRRRRWSPGQDHCSPTRATGPKPDVPGQPPGDRDGSFPSRAPGRKPSAEGGTQASRELALVGWAGCQQGDTVGDRSHGRGTSAVLGSAESCQEREVGNALTRGEPGGRQGNLRRKRGGGGGPGARLRRAQGCAHQEPVP